MRYQAQILSGSPNWTAVHCKPSRLLHERGPCKCVNMCYDGDYTKQSENVTDRKLLLSDAKIMFISNQSVHETLFAYVYCSHLIIGRYKVANANVYQWYASLNASVKHS